MNYDASIRYIRNGAVIAEREADPDNEGKYLPKIVNVTDCGSISKAKRKSRQLQGAIVNGRPTHALRCGKF